MLVVVRTHFSHCNCYTVIRCKNSRSIGIYSMFCLGLYGSILLNDFSDNFLLEEKISFTLIAHLLILSSNPIFHNIF
jgi:hypothetical protein